MPSLISNWDIIIWKPKNKALGKPPLSHCMIYIFWLMWHTSYIHAFDEWYTTCTPTFICNSVLLYINFYLERESHIWWFLANLKKCEFFQQSLIYPGYLIGGQLNIDATKIEAIINDPLLMSLKWGDFWEHFRAFRGWQHYFNCSCTTSC